jgi:hypothetical protein
VAAGRTPRSITGTDGVTIFMRNPYIEYKAFLVKVPNHPDKKKFENFIKKNSEF